jgi:hypothetical protein
MSEIQVDCFLDHVKSVLTSSEIKTLGYGNHTMKISFEIIPDDLITGSIFIISIPPIEIEK